MSYGWKITWSNPSIFDDGESIGTIGPSDIHPDILEILQNDLYNNHPYVHDLDNNHPYVNRFDMYDDDGIRYFAGVLIGDNVDGDEPLYDYGTPYAGATEIVTVFSGKEERYYA
jgi:hypothetical protein